MNKRWSFWLMTAGAALGLGQGQADDTSLTDSQRAEVQRLIADYTSGGAASNGAFNLHGFVAIEYQEADDYDTNKNVDDKLEEFLTVGVMNFDFERGASSAHIAFEFGPTRAGDDRTNARGGSSAGPGGDGTDHLELKHAHLTHDFGNGMVLTGGLMPFTADPRGFIYDDTGMGFHVAHAFGDHNVQGWWSVADNDDGTLTATGFGTAGTGTRANRDDDNWFGLRAEMDMGGMTAEPFVVIQHDDNENAYNGFFGAVGVGRSEVVTQWHGLRLSGEAGGLSWEAQAIHNYTKARDRRNNLVGRFHHSTGRSELFNVKLSKAMEGMLTGVSLEWLMTTGRDTATTPTTIINPVPVSGRIAGFQSNERSRILNIFDNDGFDALPGAGIGAVGALTDAQGNDIVVATLDFDLDSILKGATGYFRYGYLKNHALIQSDGVTNFGTNRQRYIGQEFDAGISMPVGDNASVRSDWGMIKTGSHFKNNTNPMTQQSSNPWMWSNKFLVNF